MLKGGGSGIRGKRLKKSGINVEKHETPGYIPDMTRKSSENFDWYRGWPINAKGFSILILHYQEEEGLECKW